MPEIVLSVLNVIISYSHYNPRDIHYYFSDFVSKEIEVQRCWPHIKNGRVRIST